MLAPARTSAPATTSRNRMSYICTKGLQNAPGENNCFLNCAVQVFWHLDIFRRSFRILSGHACLGHSCIFCALKVIFTQFQYSDRSVLPPNSLRKALAETFADQRRFQLGLMDDAAECFENMLTRLHFHIANQEPDDSCRAAHCLPHRKFTLAIREQIVCSCGASTEPFPYNQMVLYVSAKSLSSHATKWMEEEGNFFDPSERFSELLGRAVSDDDLRACPATCGQKTKLRRHLVNTPDIVSLGLIWETDRPSFDYILDVSETIGTSLKLQDIYDDLVPEQVRQTEYQLSGLVCYYGKHYSTFMRNSKSGSWMFFDDAAVQEVGRNFQDVMDKCCKSRFLPLLLFYVNPHGTVIDPSTAPAETVPVPGYTHRPTISHDRTSSSELDPPSQSDTARRAVTPTPFTTSQKSPRDHDRARRAVTPGPENRNKHRDHRRDKSERRGDKSPRHHHTAPTDNHQRQGSFLIAVSKNMETTEIDINDSDGSGRSRRRSRSSRHSSNVSQMSRTSDLSRVSENSRGSDRSRGSDQTDGPPPPYDSRHPGKVSLVKDKVQRQNSNASTAGGSRRKTDSVSSDTDSYLAQENGSMSPSHRNMVMLNKASMMQRKESFKKGKDKKVHADVIRFVKPPSECSDDVPMNSGSRNSVSSDDVVHKQPQQQYQQQQQQYQQQQRPVMMQQQYQEPPPGRREFWRTKSVDANLHRQLSQPPAKTQISDPIGLRPRTDQSSSRQRDEQIYMRPQDLRARRDNNNTVNISSSTNSSTSSLNAPLRPQRKAMDDSFMEVHSGTYIDNGFASLPRQKRKPQNHNYVNQSELVHQANSNPTRPVLMHSQSSDSGYISRKAVESILKQQGQNSINYKLRTAPQVKGPLKVNLEIVSQDSRDSGYRSGNGTSPSGTSPSWSNGRNSTASSEGISPVGQGFPDPPSPRQLSLARSESVCNDNKEFARSSLSPRQNFAAVRQLQRTSDVAASRDGGRVSSGDGRQAGSEHQQQIVSPRDAAPPRQSESSVQPSPDHTPQASMANSEETECAALCNHAEELISKSLQKEEHGDVHRAILYCTQAMLTLKQAMDIPYVDYQSYIRAQMKHNTCIIRNKSLHKRLSSLDSSDGTLSGGNRSSASSVSAETSGNNSDTLTGRKGRSRSYSASASVQNLAGEADSGSTGVQPSHVRSAPLTGDLQPAKPVTSTKPSLKALKNKNNNMSAESRVPEPKPEFDIYGTLPRKPKNKMTSSVSVPENLHTADVVLRPKKKNPPPPPVRRSSLVSAEADAAVEAARNYEAANSAAAAGGGGGGQRNEPALMLAPPSGGVVNHHQRQASELSEFSLPPYPDVDQNEYLYGTVPEPVVTTPLDTRWAVPANDPGFCRRCHQNQYWIPETSTCLRCDVQKKAPKHQLSQPADPRYDNRTTGTAARHPHFVDPGGGGWQHPHGRAPSGRNPQHAYNQYTVQYVTTNGNPYLGPSDKQQAIYSPDKGRPQCANSGGGASPPSGAFSPDEGIGMSSSDTTRQESTTDSDMSENKRSVLELALRFDQSKLNRLNKNLQTFAPPPQTKPQKSVSFRPDVVESEETRHRKAGYDSDYDDDTSDSCGSASPYRCGLCQKRSVEPPSVYCRDCYSYMNRLQAPKPPHTEPTAKPKRKYSGTVKTV